MNKKENNIIIHEFIECEFDKNNSIEILVTADTQLLDDSTVCRIALKGEKRFVFYNALNSTFSKFRLPVVDIDDSKELVVHVNLKSVNLINQYLDCYRVTNTASYNNKLAREKVNNPNLFPQYVIIEYVEHFKESEIINDFTGSGLPYGRDRLGHFIARMVDLRKFGINYFRIKVANNLKQLRQTVKRNLPLIEPEQAIKRIGNSGEMEYGIFIKYINENNLKDNGTAGYDTCLIAKLIDKRVVYQTCYRNEIKPIQRNNQTRTLGDALWHHLEDKL